MLQVLYANQVYRPTGKANPLSDFSDDADGVTNGEYSNQVLLFFFLVASLLVHLRRFACFAWWPVSFDTIAHLSQPTQPVSRQLTDG